jgi:uncharacterized repeat protein (TIGR03803 family)
MGSRRFSCLDRIGAATLAVLALLAGAASQAAADGWRLTVLHRFCGAAKCPDDGADPVGGVIADGSGNLYGTTLFGGEADNGTVFELTAGGQERILHDFHGRRDGKGPLAGLVMDAAGNLYGTTSFGGGATVFTGGTVFEVTAGGQERVLYRFCSVKGCADGWNPQSALVIDGSGNLYGTTVKGGTSGDAGTVFEVTPGGKERVLHSFCSRNACLDGWRPRAGLIMDATGALYGTTVAGGTKNSGTVFEITPSGDETVIYDFCRLPHCADGAGPVGALIMDGSGNLYGTTRKGGAHKAGTVFEITADGSEKVLYDFCAADSCADGKSPKAPLTMDADGNLYGTTEYGGQHNQGTVFEITVAGAGQVLHSFCTRARCADGSQPLAGVIIGASGDLYGTAGNDDGGIVYALSP